MRQRRAFKKDEQLNMRIPRNDKERLEAFAKSELRDVSDLAWVILHEWLNQREKSQAKQNVA